MVRTSVSSHSCHLGTPSNAGIADMLDDSYWQDLPDLGEHSSSDSLSAKLFSTDPGDLPFISLDHAPMATSGLDKNTFLSEPFSDFLFKGQSDALADMDIATALTNANDFSLDTAPDKQLQPGTPSGQMSHMSDLLLQLYPPRSHTPISKDTGPLPFAGQASAATETHANTMVPIEQRAAVIGPAPLQQQDAQQGSMVDYAHKGPAKHSKIIVRLKRPPTKKSKAAKPNKVASSRTSVHLASKHSPSRHLAPQRIAIPVAQVPFTAQHEQQTVSGTKCLSHSIGTQTDFAADAGCSANPLMQTKGRRPLLSANPAKALAEGTRLLLATSRAAAGTMTRRQQALVGLHDSSASAKAAPWTLLTQASMQLKLRTPVATTAIQTEDALQSDALPVSSMAALPETSSCHRKHVNHLVKASAQGRSQSDDAAHSLTSITSAHRRCQAAAQPAATASIFPKKQADPAVQAATKPAAGAAASSAGIPASNAVKAQVQQQAQASGAADAACMPQRLALFARAITNSPGMSPSRGLAGSPQASPNGAVESSPRPQTRSSNMQGGQALDSASNKAKNRDSDRATSTASATASDRPRRVDSDRAQQAVKPPRRAVAAKPRHSLSPNSRFMFQPQREPLPALVPSLLRSLPHNSSYMSQPQGQPLSASMTPSNGQDQQTGAQNESAAASHQSLANSADPSAQSDHLPAQQVRQSGYPGSESDTSAAELSDSAAEYSLSVSHHSAHKGAAVKYHVPTRAAGDKLAGSQAYLPQSGHQTQLLTDPLEIQISDGACLLSSVSPGMQPSSQSPRDRSQIQLSNCDQTPSAVTPDVTSPLQCDMKCTDAVTRGPAVGNNGGATNAADGKPLSASIADGIAAATKHPNTRMPANAGMSCDRHGSSSKGITTSQRATVSKPFMSSYEPKHPQASSIIQMNPIGSASEFPHTLHSAYADASTQLPSSNAADVTKLPFAAVQDSQATASLGDCARAGDQFLGQTAKATNSLPPLASNAASHSSLQALKASGSLQFHAAMVARPQPDQIAGAVTPIACHAGQHALSAPAQPLQAGPGCSVQGATASSQPLRQQALPVSTVSSMLKPGSDAVTRARAAAHTNSQNAASVQAGPQSNAATSVQPETRVDAKLQWPTHEDALRSDIMGTAGCRITRRLVQQILQPASEPSAVPNTSVKDAAANKGLHFTSVGKPPKTVGKPPSRLKGQIGTCNARSAASSAAVGGPSASSVGIPLSSQGRSAQQLMATAKASAIGPPQQGMPAAPVKASKAKMIKQEPAAAAAASSAFPAAPTRFKQPKTRSVSELIQMTPPTSKAIASTPPVVASTSPAAAAAAAAKDTSAAVKSASIAVQDALPAVANAAGPSKKAHKLGRASDAAQGPDGVGRSTKFVNNSRSPKAEMISNRGRPTGVQGLDDSASDAGDAQTGGPAAEPTTSCPKRQCDSSVRSDAPKKAKCATAAGLNPKFLTVKDEVLRLIGDRQNVLEGELRRRMGNNPDTSKALRKLHSEGLLQRIGHGGRPDPFKWTKVETTGGLSSTAGA
ncbi:hypothetical protein WJX77_007789 [Trebouxia sp. C0004]